MPTLVKTSVRHLNIGDVLPASEQVVTGLGAVEREKGTSRYVRAVRVINKNGNTRLAVWNASTTMRVQR